MATGFIKKADMLEIEKDIQAVLTYTFDWSEWLNGDSIQSATYDVQARLNDPTPVVVESFGVLGDKTYVKLSGGQLNKSYVVNCLVTTSNGLIDRRNFRCYITNRSA